MPIRFKEDYIASFVNKEASAKEQYASMNWHQQLTNAPRKETDRPATSAKTMAVSDCLKRFHDPIWSASEVEQFWSVIQPYLAKLLNHEMPLPDSNIDFTFLNPANEKHKQDCMQAIHHSMWKGKYSLAVANIKAVRTGRYKSRTGSTRIKSPGRINSDHRKKIKLIRE